ncbi:MAG TPA: hypothetical protein VI320_03135 [Terracidiphilus sp.]|jgi:hypothetical protein
MHGDESSPFGENEAQQILEAGWRQGSVFRPPMSPALPVPVPFDDENEWFVVCTQSCTVVSRDLAGDPHIEFLVAKAIGHYKANSQEATGKVLRRFHLPVSGLANVPALECDINRRFFVPRTLCLAHPPETCITVSEDDARNLAGWISRYYTRIALPNELVIRAKGLFDTIQTALKKNIKSGERLSSSIDKILVRWSPDSELQGGVYQLDILFLCADEAADLRLNSLLEAKLQPFTEEGGHDGVRLKFANAVKSETFLSQLDGYTRLSEWDYLSNLGDVAEDGH